MSYGGPPVPPPGNPGWSDSQAPQRPFDNSYNGGYYQSPAPQYGYAPTGGTMNMNFPPPPMTMAPPPGHLGAVYFQPDMAQPPPMPAMSVPVPMGMPANYAGGYDSRVSASDRLGPPVSSREQYQDSHLGVQDERYSKHSSPGRNSRSRDEERSYKGERSGPRGEKDRKASLSPLDDRRYRDGGRDDGSGSYKESSHDDGGRGRKQKHDERTSNYEKESEHRRERHSKSSSRRHHSQREGESSVSIDALLQDERLKNVLFAGISKATAKLEEKLQEEGNQSEGVAFLKESMKATSAQLFPSASTERQQNLKSILKRKMDSHDKGEGESSGDATASKLSALEKTLQLLRGKSNIAELMEKKRPSPEVAKGALKNLALYNDDDDDEKYLYGDKKPTKAKSTGGDHPFWSVNAVPSETEASRKGKDSFDVQEKLFEQWRQSINTSSSNEYLTKEKGKTDVSIPQVDPFFKKKIQTSMTEASQAQTNKKNIEELDSTVQNILQSIGFNFDLSKRMQELARKKKMEEDDKESGITDQSASFLSQGENLSAEVKASILKGETSIESLLKEVRARTQKGNVSRQRNESQSLERGGEWIPHNKRQGRDRVQSRSPSPDGRRSERSMSRSSQKRYEQKESEHWESVSMEDWEEGNSNSHQLRESVRDRYQNSDIATPPRSKYLDEREAEGSKRVLERYGYLQGEERTSRERSATHMSERFRSDDPKEEYFYPEDNDFSQRSSGLLTTIRSRPKEEDLSSGLFPSGPLRSQSKKMEVENLRVTSRSSNDDEPFGQTRRIILPVKSERVVVSRSPSGRESRSPGRRDMRKRSASPLQMPYSKERKIRESRDYDDYYDGYNERMPQRQSQSPDRGSYRSSEQRGVPMERQLGRGREMSPYDRQREYSREQSPSYDTFKESHQYSVEYRSPSRGDFVSQRPLQQTSKMRSDWYTSSSGRRSRSPERYRSRSPERQRSRSPDRRRSRSLERRRSRSLERRRSRSFERRRSRSLERRRSRSLERQKFRPKGSRRSRSRDRRSRSKSPDRHGRFMARKRSPGRDRHHSSGRKWVPESYHSGRQNRKPDTSKYKLDRRGEKPSSTRSTKIDMSKLAPEERKAQLQKMLKEKEKNAPASDPAPLLQSTEKPLIKTAEVVSVPNVPVAVVTQPEDKTKQNMIQAIERLANFPVEVRKELLMKMSTLPAVERKSILEELSLRQERINTLKSQVDRLKKEQNEIMRKSQRTGLGDKDPQLVAKAESQFNLEKEIARLSSAEFYIAFNDDVILPMARKKEPPLKAKPALSSKPTPAAAKTEEKDEKKEETKQVEVNPNWKSVTVKEEALPSIDTAKSSKEANVPQEKKQGKKESHSSSQSLSRSKQKVYYEYYDSGNHWCGDCNTSCNTILQFFQHTHGKKHLQKMGSRRPWNELKGSSSQQTSRKVGQALSRRVKGVEMMIPITGFYCTLCKIFCGDFTEGESHLKGDSHNEKYADFVKKNPMHEKRILLDKATAHSQKKKDISSRSESPPPPLPPLPKDKSTGKSRAESATKEGDSKVKSGKKQFRVKEKTREEGKEDNTDIVDMDLDTVSEESQDTKTKVPKLTAKTTLAAAWTPQPALPSADMKKSKEDEDTPLDTFLSIEDDKKKMKLPVESMDIADIPVPEGPSQSLVGSYPEQIPLPPLPEADVLPPLPPPPNPEGVPTVKSLSEIQEEQKKIEDEEKRMMGIDVDAEVEQPLAVPRPPPSISSLSKSDEQDASSNIEYPRKPHGKTLDSLFAKLSRTVGMRPKPKVAASETKTEMEIKIQEEIAAKLEREKQKMLRMKQREEEKERKKEEKLHEKQRLDTDSESSSEESEEDEEEEEKAMPSMNPSSSLTSDENVVSAVSKDVTPLPHTAQGHVDNFDTNRVDINTQLGVGEVTSSELEMSLSTIVKPIEDQLDEQMEKDFGDKPEELSPVASSMLSKGKKSAKPVTKGKKTVSRAKANIKDGFSDLTAFFSAPAETVSKEGQKKLVPKKSGVKKGKQETSHVRRSTRGSKPITQEEDKDSDVDFAYDEAMFGEDMIILSEVTEENDEVSYEMENQQSTIEDTILEEEKMEDRLDSNQSVQTIEESVSELVPGQKNIEESTSSEHQEPNAATEADILTSDASVQDADLSLASSDLSEAGPLPEETDIPMSSPSPVRGKGRGKKSQRGSRGKGRGRKAASQARTEQVDKTCQEKEMNMGTPGSNIVDSLQTEEKELSRSEEDSSLSSSLMENEGEPEMRKTRSRRTTALPLKIERARRTRGRARKEETEEEVAISGHVFSDGNTDTVDEKPHEEAEEQIKNESVTTDVVSLTTDYSETVEEEWNEDRNIEKEPIGKESCGTVPSDFEERNRQAKNIDEAESMPSLHQFDSLEYENVVKATESSLQDEQKVYHLSTQKKLFGAESSTAETRLESSEVVEDRMLEVQEGESKHLQEEIMAEESSGNFPNREALEDFSEQPQPQLFEAGVNEEADEVMPELEPEHGISEVYHAEKRETDSDSDATITEDVLEDPKAPCAYESAHGFAHQGSDEFAGQAEGNILVNPGYAETQVACTEGMIGQADSTGTDAGSAYFVSTHVDSSVSEAKSSNNDAERASSEDSGCNEVTSSGHEAETESSDYRDEVVVTAFEVATPHVSEYSEAAVQHVSEYGDEDKSMDDGSQQSSTQGRDVPLSGVVSEMEDALMVALGVGADLVQQSGQESDVLPTAGLSLGLEEDEDSMEFSMVDMETKTEESMGD